MIRLGPFLRELDSILVDRHSEIESPREHVPDCLRVNNFVRAIQGGGVRSRPFDWLSHAGPMPEEFAPRLATQRWESRKSRREDKGAGSVWSEPAEEVEVVAQPRGAPRNYATAGAARCGWEKTGRFGEKSIVCGCAAKFEPLRWPARRSFIGRKADPSGSRRKLLRWRKRGWLLEVSVRSERREVKKEEKEQSARKKSACGEKGRGIL